MWWWWCIRAYTPHPIYTRRTHHHTILPLFDFRQKPKNTFCVINGVSLCCRTCGGAPLHTLHTRTYMRTHSLPLGVNRLIIHHSTLFSLSLSLTLNKRRKEATESTLLPPLESEKRELFFE